MTVYELIQHLQDCDRPDAEVRLIVTSFHGVPLIAANDTEDVFYDSVLENTVIIRGRMEA